MYKASIRSLDLADWLQTSPVMLSLKLSFLHHCHIQLSTNFIYQAYWFYTRMKFEDILVLIYKLTKIQFWYDSEDFVNSVVGVEETLGETHPWWLNEDSKNGTFSTILSYRLQCFDFDSFKPQEAILSWPSVLWEYLQICML